MADKAMIRYASDAFQDEDGFHLTVAVINAVAVSPVFTPLHGWQPIFCKAVIDAALLNDPSFVVDEVMMPDGTVFSL